ncbi:hypothetical protein LCGC14_2611610 [marine sediment metagenome]|uniref:Uncharacterized protein n=1 Tax=marine sediment metagenome TaxID=412755 RepID=A0A0F9ATC6_9ZZZZ
MFCLGVLVGCTTSPKQSIDVSREKNLGQFVGRMVVVRGKVTNTKCPYINGIDMWELERLRGKVVEATGAMAAVHQRVAYTEQFQPFYPEVYHHLLPTYAEVIAEVLKIVEEGR